MQKCTANTSVRAHHHLAHRHGRRPASAHLADAQLTSPPLVPRVRATTKPDDRFLRSPKLLHRQCHGGSQTMHTLWSRTLRATKSSCRCRQCLSYSTAVARRATSAARKRFLCLPSSTILYSAIFACAAVADGHAKQQRREQWNHAIKDAKENLKHGDAPARTTAAAEDEQTPDELQIKKVAVDTKTPSILLDMFSDMAPEDLANMLKDAASDAEDPAKAEALMRDWLHRRMERALERAKERGAVPKKYEAHEKAILEWDDAHRFSMLQADRPEWPVHTGPPIDQNNLPPQSLYAADGRKLEGLESRWTRRKIQTMNLSMAKLVLRVVWATDLAAYPLLREWDSSLPEVWIPENVYWVAIKKPAQKKKFLDRINEFLQATKNPQVDEDVPEYRPIYHHHPDYQQDSDGDFHRKCHAMNARIFAAFDQCFQGKINVPQAVSNVCEEILTSSAPPNITTYSALIMGFSRLKQHKICEMVIDSMHEVHMRPDEISCTATLTHYITTDNPRSFTRFFQLMTGISTTNYALMLARPTLTLSHAATLAKFNNRVLRHPRSPHKLIQKVHPTPRVLNTIVAGLLKFHGLERTIEICANLATDGWGFDADGLTRFLHACAERADWDAGLAVWQQLQHLRALRPPSRPLDRSTYLHMLGLCWKCERDDVFGEVLREAEVHGGYRAGALKKDLEKMKRRGLDVFDAVAERRENWLLRRDLAAKFEAEGKLIAHLGDDDAHRRDEDGVVDDDIDDDDGASVFDGFESAAHVAARAAAARAVGEVWPAGEIDDDGVDDEDGAEPRVRWRPPPPSSQQQQQQQAVGRDKKTPGPQTEDPPHGWLSSCSRRGEEGGKKKWRKKRDDGGGGGDDWALD
ncbi:putative pentatricopeptide repeat domain-containing protein [Neofusicoccum parvum UCRNP2]|uniref:Putative pentatricopeptide repeat domain-containing protein n=1 Tax=Botryosphaeria parva (strain UCR-NP2) TaxID=1287680 RepID=R1GJF1_BOTPV|nr:putative pentatricopeptide repeat domain-containing protein [Neofusicoccum parvum UCRNP2]